jgi:hypothetical protein
MICTPEVFISGSTITFTFLGFQESKEKKCGSASFSMFLQWIGEQASRTFFTVFLVA